MNYFIEGLQGIGKSTLVKRLSEMHPEYLAVHEGDYSPVELAWCAYVRKDEYEGILEKYDPIRREIEEKSDVVLCAASSGELDEPGAAF